MVDPSSLLALFKLLQPYFKQGLGAVDQTAGDAAGALGGPISLATGIAGGDPLSAIRGVNSSLGSLGNLTGVPGLADWSSYLGGPLNIAGGIMSGNPVSAISGAVNTANTASGALGGPTLSSLIGEMGGTVAGGAAGAGLGAMAAIPLMMLGGLWSNAHNMDKQQEIAQGLERKYYQNEWPGLTQARESGAGLLSHMGEITPEMLPAALMAATRGIRASDLAPASANLQGDEGGKSNDLSDWVSKAPQLEGQNWASWLGLMDRAQQAGLDPGQLAAMTVPKPHEQPSVHQHMFGPPSQGMMVGGQANDITDYGHSTINLKDGHLPLIPTSPTDPTPKVMSNYEPGQMWGGTTQEANDISNAIAGLGQQFGINWGAIPEHPDTGGWQNQGYTIQPEQLEQYGFKPGQYGPAALNYLKQIDPNVASNPNFTAYEQALGVSPASYADLPQGLQRLSGSPFAVNPYLTEAQQLQNVFGPGATGGAAPNDSPGGTA